MSQIITRFPPSPTGWFHIGNARTALFNYLYTKKVGGKLLFRLEDTDRERSKDEYANDIIDGLGWLGIELDFTNVYKQSEHGETYKKYIEKMIAEDKAYISKEEPKEEGGRAEVIRLRNPGKVVTFDDLIRDKVSIDTAELGDFIIAKSLTEPVYHLAVVVDDFEMGVTHIIRGEDGIYNTPRQILIQEAIGAPRPTYAHVPFILNDDRSKLSKRKQGEKVSLKYYRELGFLPEAMVNFLAFIGWNPGDEREIMSLAEMVEAFDIGKVQKAGGVFNQEKLLWINREYLKKLPKEIIEAEIGKRVLPTYPDVDLVNKIIPLILDRISVWSDVDNVVKSGEFDFVFKAPTVNKDILVWKKSNREETRECLSKIIEILKDIPDNNMATESIKARIMPYAEEKGKGNVLWPARYALSGQEKSPDPFTIIEILGKDESVRRLMTANELLAD